MVIGRDQPEWMDSFLRPRPKPRPRRWFSIRLWWYRKVVWFRLLRMALKGVPIVENTYWVELYKLMSKGKK